MSNEDHNVMKARRIKIVTLVLAAMGGSSLNGNGQRTEWKRDHLFPSRGRAALSVATGVPFAGAAEIAFGFSEGFAAGVVVGKIPMPGAAGFGLRIRKLVLSPNVSTRVYAEFPVFVYPESRRRVREPWFLIYGNLMAEKRLASGVRIAAGGGLLGGGCLSGLIRGHNMPKEEHAHMARKESVFGKDGEVMGGIWYTINTGVAFSITRQLMFQQRVDVVMSGIHVGKLPVKEWLYNPPVIMVTGLTYAL